MRSRPGTARTILLSHIISARPSKQPLMIRTFLKVYMELGFYFLLLQKTSSSFWSHICCAEPWATKTLIASVNADQRS